MASTIGKHSENVNCYYHHPSPKLSKYRVKFLMHDGETVFANRSAFPARHSVPQGEGWGFIHL